MNVASLLGPLHHVGFVVDSLDVMLPAFAHALGAEIATEIFHDPLQKTRVVFLRTSRNEATQIELVEPASQDSPVRRFLEKNRGGMHHLCYEVKDIQAALKTLREKGATIVSRPKPAVAFGGRHVAWVMTAQWLLLELLEKRDL